jgi:hypothetical protein
MSTHRRSGGEQRRQANDATHPWLRINRVLRVMLHTHWSAEAWSQAGVEFRRALAPAERDPAARAGSTRLVTAPSSCGAVLVRVVAFG